MLGVGVGPGGGLEGRGRGKGREEETWLQASLVKSSLTTFLFCSWLIFWVITNVSTSFYAIPLSPGFFQFGYALPLYHIVNGSRTLLFDTHSRIGLNFGVLFAWCAVNTLLFPPCCVFMRWKTNKELARRVPRRTIKYLVDG